MMTTTDPRAQLAREEEVQRAVEALTAAGDLLGRPAVPSASGHLWLTMFASAPPGAILAAVTAHLLDPAVAHRWPLPADLARHMRNIQDAHATAPDLDALDPDAAYRVVRDYLRGKAHHWPGGRVLRQAREAAGQSPDAARTAWLAELVRRYPGKNPAVLHQYAGWSPAVENGAMNPSGSGEHKQLIAHVYGAETLEAALAATAWDELAERAPLIAEIASRCGTVLEWTMITDATEAAFRKAFRDTFEAAQVRTRTMERARQLPGTWQQGHPTNPLPGASPKPRPALELVPDLIADLGASMEMQRPARQRASAPR